MSIDFNATLQFDVNLGDLDRETGRLLARLTASSAPFLRLTLWPEFDSFGTGDPGIQTGLDAWHMGSRNPDRWFRFAGEPNVLVDGSTQSWEEDGDFVTHFEVTASWRTAASVVVAIAVLLAAAELGRGTFDANIEQVSDGQATSPADLVERLRLTEPRGDFEEAARVLLSRTPGFAAWSALSTS